MERLRTRVSPIPTTAAPTANVFPTVLEEPLSPSDDPGGGEHGIPMLPGDSPTEMPMVRKPRRRLPCVNAAATRSSRSFDSGISHLLTTSDQAGQPPPPGTGTGTGTGNPDQNISSTRQSTLVSSASNYLSASTPPCNSPGPPPRSPNRLLSTASASPAFSRSLSNNGVIKPPPLSASSASCSSPSAIVNGGGPPVSPTYKIHQRPGVFNSRRFSSSDHNENNGSMFNFSTSRTLSPNNLSSYPNSTKSSPVLRASPPVLTSSHSLPSNESDSSPPTVPSPTSPGPSPASPVLRVSRRMLPEPPKRQVGGSNGGIPLRSANGSVSGSTNPASGWQSRDSLDSGVYSRSTTCDSAASTNYGGHSAPPPASRQSTDSPVLRSKSPPPQLARHSWRRTSGIARLPEPPTSAAAASCSTPPNAATMAKSVHFNSGDSEKEPPGTATKRLLASLKSHYNNSRASSTEQSPVKHAQNSSGGTGSEERPSLLTRLHEKLAATRSHPNHRTVNMQTGSGQDNLDVPKLRDLKSHSFPPPINNDTSSSVVNNTVNHQYQNTASPLDQLRNSSGGHFSYHRHFAAQNAASKATGSGSYHQVVSNGSMDSLTSDDEDGESTEDSLDLDEANASFTNMSRETTDERRKRWLVFNHTLSKG